MLYKLIIINDQTTTYRIYENGQLMNEKTGKYYKGTIRGGYRWFDLRWNNSKYSRSQHRLLAESFIENPEQLPYVHHIDNDKLNNSLSNLKWISASENNLSVNKQKNNIDHSDQNVYTEIELWKPFRDTKYMVSNLGRVKNADTNKILQGKITLSGYREYCLHFNNKKQNLFGHKIVYEVWNSTQMDKVNHIDGNKLNNRITNLESVSNSENVIKAIYDTKVLRFKKTAQYDKEGNLIQIFLNNADAARAMGVKPQSIQAAIKKNRLSCGYYWKNIEE